MQALSTILQLIQPDWSSTMRYGTANPEKVVSKLMNDLTSAECAGVSVNAPSQMDMLEAGASVPTNHSKYRETVPGPRWTWERYGRTITMLPDGRIVHIGGTYEDFYDPDFCIYNDVFVQNPDGRVSVYLYPKDDFPPTDQHTATLIGDDIILIGSCGYHDLREIGATQVMKLDTHKFRMTRLVTKGDRPGWISGHLAEKLDENRVLVAGGHILTSKGFQPNRQLFELDVAGLTWRVREHGDTTLFPVSSAQYKQFKSPRSGTANPEEVDNPFWLEMARRRWPASRARLHFGDFAPLKSLSKSGNVDAAISTPMRAAGEKKIPGPHNSEIVWTAVRDDALKVALNDGRRLQIGGIIRQYRDESTDARIYNDVIVAHPDGTIRILAYPEEVFPNLAEFIGVLRGEDVFIFGSAYRERPREEPIVLVTLQLNTSTFSMDRVAASPPAGTLFYKGAKKRDGDRVSFPVNIRERPQAAYCVAFDLVTLEWGEPVPDPDHVSTE